MRAFAAVFLAATLGAIAQEAPPDLRDLDLRTWEGRNRPEGLAKTEIAAQRNRQKNRPWRNVDRLRAESWTFDEFVAKTQAASEEIGLTSAGREGLTTRQRRTLRRFEDRVVSVTGWLVLEYPAQAESVNSDSLVFHDWHLEISPIPLTHYPTVGDPTPIVAEITPRTERAVYRSGIRLNALAAWTRSGQPPDLKIVATGSAPHKVRVTGYLFWDDPNSESEVDTGQMIANAEPGKFHHPWRVSGWEIHPVLRIEDLGAEDATRSGVANGSVGATEQRQ